MSENGKKIWLPVSVWNETKIYLREWGLWYRLSRILGSLVVRTITHPLILHPLRVMFTLDFLTMTVLVTRIALYRRKDLVEMFRYTCCFWQCRHGLSCLSRIIEFLDKNRFRARDIKGCWDNLGRTWPQNKEVSHRGAIVFRSQTRVCISRDGDNTRSKEPIDRQI